MEERTLTAFNWLYTPYQHRIVSRVDLESPNRESFGQGVMFLEKYMCDVFHVNCAAEDIEPGVTVPPS
ncbi:hypothetical protein scyTo_0013440 [Scyliorhinus torazame]|uniref:Uncharacterized protein n=1 Tax=Scyliorhinus torazame TaxID=75743 RepID=A0A401NWN8_SCYTO|nr:hypothetical protein [Scyliorhinus torazame]